MENKQQPLPAEMVKCLGSFFKRGLITIPLTRKHQHQQFQQRSGLQAATLELDTGAYPNIEFVAGSRLSVYPPNPADHVQAILKHLVDDVSPVKSSSGTRSPRSATGHQQHGPSPASNDNANDSSSRRLSELSNESWAKFIQLNGRESLRLALTHLYDIMTPPSRDLLRLMADFCGQNQQHRNRLQAICKSDESWEKWICATRRTIRSTLEEFESVRLPAWPFLKELSLQQPRQYSISSIKSTKRFRVEIIVFEHRFSARQIGLNLQNVREREKLSEAEPSLAAMATASGAEAGQKSISSGQKSSSKLSSMRSIRSISTFAASPISTHQLKVVPTYSGPLMSSYAASVTSAIGPARDEPIPLGAAASRKQQSASRSPTPAETSNSLTSFGGLCSRYLLELKPQDQVLCEFIENPLFTLKGNRERPIMMIGQDVGVVAFRAFWQQRGLEHDRAQIFYSLFKDLSPKKFGDMQLVCVTGSRCKVEDLFKREIDWAVSSKILASAQYIQKNHINGLIEQPNQMHPTVSSLGQRIYKLLVGMNGCLYTCCDPQVSQAIEILIVESCSKHMSRQQAVSLLPKWKGRQQRVSSTGNIENHYEHVQIVQEIYDFSI